jgi:hypothetical protein
VISLKPANILLTIFVSALLKVPAFGTSGVPLTLAWDPSTDPTVIGYRVYQGGASDSYTNVEDIGILTIVAVSNLLVGATYYFAVTSYDVTGLESAFSGEISFTVPTSSTSPSSLPGSLLIKQNSYGQTVLSGTGSAGSVFIIQASQDFSSWVAIGSVTIDPSGAFQFIDPDNGPALARFYRLGAQNSGTNSAAP